MMSPDKLQEILAEHGKWLRCEGGTRADLRGADLTRADLRGAVLTGAVLTDAVLTDAVLTDAVLTGADLRGADLTRADLTGADLRGADLTRADLTDAVLTDGKYLARASVQFSGHGECGRELMAIKTSAKENPVTLWCGCFMGTPEELVRYIAEGGERHRKSRTLAIETVLMLLNYEEGTK